MSIKRKGFEKVSRKTIQENKLSNCPLYPSFSFSHITNNSKYNFEYFKSSQEKEKLEVLHNLYLKLEEWSTSTWMELLAKRKAQGIETIQKQRMNFEPKDITILPDEKIYVMRFDRQRKRILGVKKSCCSTFYIVGYDFDLSAYTHE